MALSQNLRYEWSKLYRARMERIGWMVGLVFGPMCAGFLAGVMFGPWRDRDLLLTVGAGVAGSVLMVLTFRWFDCHEERRFQAFLHRARELGGWWFLRDHRTARPTIVHADELKPDFRMVGLMERLDLLGRDDHEEVIRAEIRRFHELARGSDQVASQYRQQAECFETLLQPM